MSYLSFDTANGKGVRCTLFVSGCEMACTGCHNIESWKLTAGQPYTKDFEDRIIEDLSNHYIEGFSASGGNPTHYRNYKTMLGLFKRIKEETGKNIWMWTGMTLEELKNDEARSEILNYVDVLIDGKFVLDKRDITLQWRGSDNQRVIEVKNI